MFYKVTEGKDKGRVFIASDVNDETGMVKDQEGKEYHILNVAELTPEEQERHIKIEEIAI